MKDFRGNEIVVGSNIVYPGGTGTDLMNEGFVLEVTEGVDGPSKWQRSVGARLKVRGLKRNRWDDTVTGDYITFVTRVDRVVVLV